MPISPKPPLVSVIITCHNYGRFLAESIQSALDQTYQPVEVIVVDDGSADNTKQVAAGYPSITYLYQVNSGVAMARDAGVQKARGEYIFFLDADDRLDNTCIEQAWSMLQSHPEASFCYTQMRYFGQESGTFLSRPFSIAHLVVIGNYIGIGALVPRSIFLGVGGFEKLPTYEDWDFWLKVAQQGYRGVLLPKPLYFWRQHGASRNPKSRQEKRASRQLILRRHRRLFWRWQLTPYWLAYKLYLQLVKGGV